MDILLPVLIALAAAAAGVAAAAGTGVKGIVAAWFKRRERAMLKEGYAQGLKNLAEFSGILERLRRVQSVDRVLVFVGQNGGGLPVPGKPYTVRSYFGWSTRPGVESLGNYNFDLLVDRAYMTMLLKMIEEGSVVNTTETMSDGAILRTFYRDEGVKQSLLYFLNCDESQLVYLSVASYAGEFTADQKVLIEMEVQRLRAVMTRV